MEKPDCASFVLTSNTSPGAPH